MNADFRCARYAKTELHPCSVERLPGYRGHFAVGMYELNEATGTRKGGIGVYKSLFTSGPSDPVYWHSFSSSGVLDMKPRGCLLASALSTSQINILKFGSNDEEGGQPAVQWEYISPQRCDDGLFLSLDWSSGSNSGGAGTDDAGVGGGDALVATSTQCGSVRVFHCPSGLLQGGASSGLHLQERKALHNLHRLCGETVPCWITAFDPHDAAANTLLSGGDDGSFKLYDLRMVDDSEAGTGGDEDCSWNESLPPPVAVAVNRYNTAGVTTAEFHPLREHVFATGSYSGVVAVWDSRRLKVPVAAEDTGGGVWRAKWVPENSGYGSDQGMGLLLTSCMHAGSRVYRLGGSGEDGQSMACVVSHNPETEQQVIRTSGGGGGVEDAGVAEGNPAATAAHLAYGIDLVEAEAAEGRVTVASCSFYDNSVSLWSFSR